MRNKSKVGEVKIEARWVTCEVKKEERWNEIEARWVR